MIQITPPLSVSRRPFYASLKTNALYDLLLIPSVGAEVWLGRMMSVNANWSYAWWSIALITMIGKLAQVRIFRIHL